MKTTFFYAAVLILNLGCKGQADNITQENNHNIKRFDIENFEANRQGKYYYFKNSGGDEVRQSVHYKQSDTLPDRFVEDITMKNSRITLQNIYYPDGYLKREMKIYRERFVLGITKYYDPNGNLEKAIDHDAPFTFSWEQVEKYIQERNIPELDSNYTIERTGHDEIKFPQWTIGYLDRKLGKMVAIVLNGKTGERLREEHHVIRWEENLMGPTPEPIIVFDKQQPQKKSSEIYKTHKGKNYTKPEWEEFEKQQFEDFKKNRDKN